MSEDVTQPDAATDDTDIMGVHKTAAQDQFTDSGKKVEDGDQGDKPDAAEKLADAEARADKYARALFESRVAATGRLADPTDMPFNAELLDDADALKASIDALLEAKPHLATRKPAWGDVGAGQAKASESGPSFADLFR